VTSQPRKIAALLVQRVLDQGESLGSLLGAQLARLDDPRQRALAQELVFGTLRWSYRLEALLARLLRKPLKKKDRDLHALLLVGLYQLLILEMPAHAAVSETVEVARQLGKDWAAGMVNGVLRNAQRQSAALLKAVQDTASARWSHPDWWIERLQQDWPENWQQILKAGNQRPPMVLRVNRLQTERDDYLQQLQVSGIEALPLPFTESAIQLEQPVGVDSLPGFREGRVSVQDGAAQLCASLLDLQAGQRVLDACAAPGGKTGHILELAPQLESLLAIDVDETRLQKVRENLQRLHLDAGLLAADAGDPQAWWDGKPFDRILLDAPCSASGVVRRHPNVCWRLYGPCLRLEVCCCT
jgi:16S rRNA (cytosine967-C5)-methyltransferase